MQDNSILPRAWQIPQPFRDRLGTRVGRQRPMVAEGHLLLVLHAPPNHDDRARIGRFFWRKPDGSWSSKDLGSGTAALNKHLDEYEDHIDRLDREEEQAKTAGDYFSVLQQLTPIHRAVRNQHQVLEEARKLCPDYREIIDARDRAYAIQRTAELLFDGTKNALDFTVAKRAEDQSQASERMLVAAHRLNILAALFFPILTLTAILGVDFKTLASILGLDESFFDGTGYYPAVFLGLVVVGLAMGTVLTSFVTRSSDRPARMGAENRSSDSR